MKLSLLLIAVVISTSLYGQNKQRTIMDRENNLIEHYNSTGKDTLFKNGRYSAYTYFSNSIICKGFYKNNLKDSVWCYYSRGVVIDSGYYREDKKIGVWQSYKTNGQLQVQYDFTNKKLLIYNPEPQDADTSALYSVVNNTESVMTVLDRAPIYLDGDTMFKNTIVLNLPYPQQAREAQIQGKVIISFIVDENGHPTDYKILKKMGYGLDKAALNAVKHATGDWLPGLLKGKPVAVEHIIPVSFSLPQ
ncbi:MAG: TonB family protein [Mucilaginibacter sp.]